MSDWEILDEIQMMLDTGIRGTTTASVKITSRRKLGLTVYRFAGGPGAVSLRLAITAYLQRGIIFVTPRKG